MKEHVKTIFILLLWLPQTIWAAPLYDPGLSWRTIETPHFSIHYHDKAQEVAKRVAKICEDIYARLTKTVKWVPSGKTQIVITDITDSANGLATVFPYKTIRIFVSAPQENSALDFYDDWLTTLLTHEYTHILQLDSVHGLPRLIRYILGNVISPNGALPQWMIEGYATYEETLRTSAGRGRATHSEMLLRMAVLEDQFTPIDRAAGGFRDWPAGAIPYIFGAKFHLYLAERFGEDKVADLYQAYSGRTIPFFVESNAKAIFGEKISDLWEDWGNELKIHYLEQKIDLEKEGLREGRVLTELGKIVQTPVFFPDSQKILFATSDFDGPPRLRTFDLETGKIETFLRNIRTENLSWHTAQNSVVFSQSKSYKQYYQFEDIYLLSMDDRKIKPITQGKRVRDPDLHPDGKRIAAVQNELGQTNLVIVDRETATMTPVTHSTNGTQYSTPRWAPDGSFFVASVKTFNASRSLIRFIPETGYVSPWLCDGARNIHPAWSPDGQFLLYSSDRTGISNLYALDLQSDSIYQITNVLGGAFMPNVSPDQKRIAFIGYHARGFDIHLLPFDPKTWKMVGKREDCQDSYAPQMEGLLAFADPNQEDLTWQEHPYSPWRTLLPTAIFPRFQQGSIESIISLETDISDVLGYHAYNLALQYTTGSQRLGFSGIYQNNILPPSFFIGGARFTVPTFVRLFTVRGEQLRSRLLMYEERDRIFAGLSYLFRWPFSFRMSLSYAYERREPLGGEPIVVPLDPAAIPLIVETEPATLTGVRVSFSKSNTTSYPNSISPEKGRRIQLTTSYWPDYLGSDFHQATTTFDWREFIGIPWWKHQVIAFNLSGGAALGETLRQRTFFLGGAIGESYFFAGSSTVHVLRGYPDFIFAGQRMLAGSLEYRFPLTTVARGYKTLPIFLDQVHGLFFADYGNAFDTFSEFGNFHLGVGAELKADLIFGYGAPLTLRLGAGSALSDPEGEPFTVYFEFGTVF